MGNLLDFLKVIDRVIYSLGKDATTISTKYQDEIPGQN